MAKCGAAGGADAGKVYRLEAGKLRYFTPAAYTSWASPAPTFTDDSFVCCQLGRCAKGSDILPKCNGVLACAACSCPSGQVRCEGQPCPPAALPQRC